MKITIRVLFLFASIILLTCDPNTAPLTKGIVITRSTKIPSKVYTLNSQDLEEPMVVIQGENIVVDFNNSILQGNDNSSKPDQYKGLAVLVKGGKNITIKNLNVKGYKVALMAQGTKNLHIENSDLSYNYRPHLNSTQKKEDVSDWMSYHHNESNEWLRYGAAIYLEDCDSAEINYTIIKHGQNALMMTRCNNARVVNNTFAFNSGIGIGMYRSSSNVIAYNNLNFNVRGYSHQVYNRGQDSAGILLFEQCNDNVFYNNSVTHGGDGFFLWAGQSTMDNGQGGCNDNVLLNNDFSFAPTNGVEVTFSRNIIADNLIRECDHGIWGGYSYETKISGNQFEDNRIDIAIEHGQQNQIAKNIFESSSEGIKLWQRDKQPGGWGYVENRNTESKNYVISENTFRDVIKPYNIIVTDSVIINKNIFINSPTTPFEKSVTHLDTAASKYSIISPVDLKAFIPNVKNPIDPFKDSARFKGRDKILMTEWGPYSFDYPLIWNHYPLDTTQQINLMIHGPKGAFRIINTIGLDNVTLNTESTTPFITANRVAGSVINVKIELEYIGDEFIDSFGNSIPKNTPYHFSYNEFFQPINFNVSWFDLDTLHHPLKTGVLFQENARMRPFKVEKTDRLDYAWWGGIKERGVAHKQFITLAEGEAELEQGRYEIGITWDDAVRVFIDNQLIIDEWHELSSDYDESPHKRVEINLSRGTHQFKVEHIELKGMASLSLKLKKLN